MKMLPTASAPVALTLLLAAAPGSAATNEGFTVSIDNPLQIANPDAGDEIDIVVRAQNTTEVKQLRLLVRYESEYFEFVGFAAGDHPAGLQAFPESPTDDGDGFFIAAGGGAVLLAVR